MAELKTKATNASVMDFLNTIKDTQRRQDCLTIVELMRKASRSEPKMWGSSIIGFGTRHYVYESGREGDMFLIGFSPRKQNLTLYIGGFEQDDPLLKKLGKYKTGGSCLYIIRLQDVDLLTLQKLIDRSAKRHANPTRDK